MFANFSYPNELGMDKIPFGFRVGLYIFISFLGTLESIQDLGWHPDSIALGEKKTFSYSTSVKHMPLFSLAGL